MSSTPAVSVVCATYRRPDRLARLLAALAAQDVTEPFEVVIVDDGSGEATLAELRQAVDAFSSRNSSPLRLIANEENCGAATARNDGWRAARGAVIAFTDDDCQPASDWLRTGLDRMRRHHTAIVVGAVGPDPAQCGQAGPWSRTLVVDNARYFQTANAFYWRADLEAVDGFDPAFGVRAGEDTDLGLRVVALNRQAIFAPEVQVLHDVRHETAMSLARINSRRWVDLPLVVRKHPHVRATNLHWKLFWKPTHPATIVAMLALAASPVDRRALTLVMPWVGERLLVHMLSTSWRDRLLLLPGAFANDAAEVVSCVRGSLKHRTLLL